MRQLHIVNLSLPKTGTKSVAGLFSAFRARHEYQFDAATKILEAYSDGRISRVELSAFLLTRQALGQLEVDSSSVNFWFVREFITLMPQAKFLVVLREPLSWLESVLAHLQRDAIDASTRGLPFPASFMRLAKVSGVCFDPSMAQNAEVYKRALPDLSRRLLQFWTSQNQQILAVVPPNRRLVLGTEYLSVSHRALSSFAGIEPGMLTANTGHLHKRPVLPKLKYADLISSSLEPEKSQALLKWANIRKLITLEN